MTVPPLKTTSAPAARTGADPTPRRGGTPLKLLEHGGERVLAVVLTWSFPLFLLLIAVSPWHPIYAYAWDFHAFYAAGARYLHLHSPYVAASLANLTSKENFVYPLPVAALFAPVSLVPYPVAAVFFIALNAVLLGLTLKMLNVRDWRCYAAVYLSLPIQIGLKLGTISPLLAFLLAVLWRYRNRALVVAPTLALLVISKLFLWPVALWFLFTRRYRGFFGAVTIACVSLLAATAPLGFGTLIHYPGLLRAVSSLESPQSLSTFALLHALGLSTLLAEAGTLAFGAVLLALAYRSARRDDSYAFRMLVVAALVLSPLVWGHYVAVLLVPLALVRPTFSPVWFALAWTPGDGYAMSHGVFIFVTTVVLALVFVQGGVVDLAALKRRLRLPAGLRLRQAEAMMALWLLFLVPSADAAGNVGTIAALRPPSTASHADGTATLRFLGNDRTVCWRVWTRAVPATAMVELVETAQSRVVAAHMLGHGTRYETCTPVQHSMGAKLRRVFTHRSAGFDLVVRSRSGRLLLRGRVVRPVDAGRRGA